MVLQAHVLLCMRVGFVKKKIYCPKNGENGLKMGQKQGFLDLLKNLVIFSEFGL